MTLALWIGAVVLAANVAVVLAGLVVAARRPRRASRWERGAHAPSGENLEALADALGIEVADLYRERAA